VNPRIRSRVVSAVFVAVLAVVVLAALLRH
jgi:hypothetical protein